MDNNSSRRNFLKNTALTTAFSFGIPQIISSSFAAEKSSKKIQLHQDDVILFQGDSITDAGRKKDSPDAHL